MQGFRGTRGQRKSIVTSPGSRPIKTQTYQTKILTEQGLFATLKTLDKTQTAIEKQNKEALSDYKKVPAVV